MFYLNCGVYIFGKELFLRLRCVEWLGVVSDVLCGMEDAKRKTSQKVARAEKTRHWTQSKSSLICKR